MNDHDLLTASRIVGELQASAEKRYWRLVSIRLDNTGMMEFLELLSGDRRATYQSLESAWMHLIGPVESEMDIPEAKR